MIITGNCNINNDLICFPKWGGGVGGYYRWIKEFYKGTYL